MTSKKKRLSKFNFEDEGSAVALVSSEQGGPANGVPTLLTKSTKNVNVEKATEEEIQKAATVDLQMPLLEFLTRYIGMWIGDAEIIAGMLGMTFEDLYQEGGASGFQEMVQTNLDTVSQVNKSKEIERFEGAFEEYKKLVSKASSSVEDGGNASKSTEESSSKTNEVEKTMSDKTEVTQESLEEQINKAAEAIVEKRLEEVQKAADEKVKAVSKELEVFKAREDAREKQEYLAKAESYAKYLGEGADKESIAKSLSFIEKSEDAQAAAELLKSLKDALDKESGFEEIGKSATEDQPTDDEAKIATIQKSLVEDGMPTQDAYVKAFEQVKGV